MYVALLGDIHGNSYALEKVISQLPKSIDQLWVTGDLVGYYYNVNEVIEMLSQYKCKIIQGNHERYLYRALVDPQSLKIYTEKYGSSLQQTIKSLSKKNLQFLIDLPMICKIKTENKTTLICHGSPWDSDAYVYPDCSTETKSKYDNYNYDFIIQGHTHYPMILEQGHKKIINPGSVGQSRNKLPEAHWATLDTESGQTEFFKVDYDKKKLIDQVNQFDQYNKYLKTVIGYND